MQSSPIWLLSPFITLNSYSCVHVCTCTCFYVCMCEEACSKPWMLYFRYDLLHFETGFLTGAQGSWIWLKCVAKSLWNPRLPIPASAPALGLSACNTAPIFFCGCWGWNLGSLEVELRSSWLRGKHYYDAPSTCLSLCVCVTWEWGSSPGLVFTESFSSARHFSPYYTWTNLFGPHNNLRREMSAFYHCRTWGMDEWLGQSASARKPVDYTTA